MGLQGKHCSYPVLDSTVFSVYFGVKFRSLVVVLIKMRKKRCALGTCNSDSHYSSEDYMSTSGVTFRIFPKPKTQLEKWRKWTRLCNRPHTDLSVYKIGGDDYVCSNLSQK
ncbi:hypothetical protein PoB_000517200 [Plakobranchus ocellatus]|uniref:THAP-type domain-containing protein n=1 Tax=Plakobranchus ocellatus TaxID=259542 RepID=A0AAV3Y964_9GAST|nr:hypothetical protein PoB_000517200 [Plakobranchus ocellatus]